MNNEELLWQLVVPNKAQREIRRLARQDQPRIRQAPDDLRYFPRLGDLRKIQGFIDRWRLREGSMRATFQVDSDNRHIVILEVRYRGNAYRN